MTLSGWNVEYELLLTRALAYVPSRPYTSMGGFGSAAAVAYVLDNMLKTGDRVPRQASRTVEVTKYLGIMVSSCCVEVQSVSERFDEPTFFPQLNEQLPSHPFPDCTKIQT